MRKLLGGLLLVAFIPVLIPFCVLAKLAFFYTVLADRIDGVDIS